MNINHKKYKSPYNKKQPTKHQLKARFLARATRDSELENLHAGKFPSSKTGDFSDVKVVTPYGEIPWNELSRISNEEMRNLMLDIESNIINYLKTLEMSEKIHGEELMNKSLEAVNRTSASWDRD